MIKLGTPRHLFLGAGQALLDGALGFTAAATKAGFEGGKGWRLQEHLYGMGQALANLPGAFHFDFEQNRPAFLELGFNGAKGRAIAVACKLGPFQEAAAGDRGLEGLTLHEAVILSVHLAAARRPCGGGNG